MARIALGESASAFWQSAALHPPRWPQNTWRTYARHCAALARIERSLFLPRRRYWCLGWGAEVIERWL